MVLDSGASQKSSEGDPNSDAGVMGDLGLFKIEESSIDLLPPATSADERVSSSRGRAYFLNFHVIS